MNVWVECYNFVYIFPKLRIQKVWKKELKFFPRATLDKTIALSSNKKRNKNVTNSYFLE